MNNPASSSLPHIQALVDAGGQIMVGTVKPIVGADVAHDGEKTLVMLKRRPGESLPLLLSRLDTAIQTAHDKGVRVDEINKPDSDVRYRYKK